MERSSTRPESAGHFNRLRAGDLDICLEIFFQLFVKKSKLLYLEKDVVVTIRGPLLPFRVYRKRKGWEGMREGGRGGREEGRRRAQARWVRKAPAFTSW